MGDVGLYLAALGAVLFTIAVTVAVVWFVALRPMRREQARLRHELHNAWSVLGPVAAWAYRAQRTPTVRP